MGGIKKTLQTYPVIMSLVTIMLFTFITEIVHMESLFESTFDQQTSSYLAGICVQGLASVVMVVIMWYFIGFEDAHITRVKDWKQIWISWPIVLLILLMAWPIINGSLIIDNSSPIKVVSYILVYFSTGFYEELLCRGLVLSILIQKWGTSKKGIYQAVVVSSMMFASIHLLNVFLGRSYLSSGITQLIFSTFLGVFFAACVIRNNSIWVAIIMHAIFNIFGDIDAIAIGATFGERSKSNTTLGDAIGSIIVCAPLFIYGLFILRKVNAKQH